VANSLNTSPVVITAAQTSYKGATLATLGALTTLRIERVYWEAPSTVGHVALITDPASGRTIVRLQCASAGAGIDQDWTANPKMVSDFAVPQIDSGNLYIHLR